MSEKLRFGICAWSRWGDDVVDRPDNTDELVVANIVHHLRSKLRIDLTWCLQQIDDFNPHFVGEAAAIRKEAWDSFISVVSQQGHYPDLDVVFCRWRWDVGVKDDPRLVMQRRMLDRYCNTNTRILIWDEDFKLTSDERTSLRSCSNVTFIETSEVARLGSEKGLVYVPHPIEMPPIDDIVARVLPPAGRGIGDHLDQNLRVAYVGNNYERSEFVRLFHYELFHHPNCTHFYGNWRKYDAAYEKDGITFHPKVGRQMRDWVYQHATCVPMLAKDVYFERGHITPRLHEVVTAGGIPVGFSSFRGFDRYYPPRCTAYSAADFACVVDELAAMSHDERKKAVREQAEKLIDERIFDVPLFFESIGL